MKVKFLWIEDNATTDLKHLLGPIYMSGKYDPVIALTVADGLHRMWQTEFAAVIVDIRLLPGNAPDWVKLYSDQGGGKGAARLGLRLLFSLFKPQDDDIKLTSKPKWLRPKKFGVLTVEDESEIKQELKLLDIDVYERKTARTPNTVLLKMVEKITGGPK